MVRLVLLAALVIVAGFACGDDPNAVRMGTEGAYPPYNFINDEGEVDGFERELGDELCRRADLECTWVTNDWDSIIPNLVEGETYELKVWASAASSRDATFVVRRDRAASDAGEDDFILEPASIVIKAGAREGTAALKIVDDGLDERSEALVLAATAAGGEEVGSLVFTLWDAAVPVLPPAAQLFLGVLLAIGAYRRHRNDKDSGVA